jgi:transposase
MGNSKRKEKQEAIKLLRTGITQKEVSKNVGVNEKTMSIWAREWKQEAVLDNRSIANLKNRLFETSANIDTPTEALKNLVWCIKQLEKTTTKPIKSTKEASLETKTL